MIIEAALAVSSSSAASIVAYRWRASKRKRLRDWDNNFVVIEGFTEDQSTDWNNRYRAWCQEKGLHYELGTCTYCADCKKKAQAVTNLYTGARCMDCGQHNCLGCYDRFDSYGSSSYFGDSGSSSYFGDSGGSSW